MYWLILTINILTSISGLYDQPKTYQEIAWEKHETKIWEYVRTNAPDRLLSDQDISDMLEAIRYNYIHLHIPCALQLALIEQESTFNKNARNERTRAAGLFQILPGTAKFILMGPKSYRYRYLFDPKTSVLLGGKYLRLLIDIYGFNKTVILAHYNGGPRKWRGSLGFARSVLRREKKIQEYGIWI